VFNRTSSAQTNSTNLSISTSLWWDSYHLVFSLKNDSEDYYRQLVCSMRWLLRLK